MDDGISPQAKMVSDLVFMKASAMKANDLAEIDYEIEVEFPDGTKLRDQGTLRRDPWTENPPPYESGAGGVPKGLKRGK